MEIGRITYRAYGSGSYDLRTTCLRFFSEGFNITYQRASAQQVIALISFDLEPIRPILPRGLLLLKHMCLDQCLGLQQILRKVNLNTRQIGDIHVVQLLVGRQLPKGMFEVGCV